MVPKPTHWNVNLENFEMKFYHDSNIPQSLLNNSVLNFILQPIIYVAEKFWIKILTKKSHDSSNQISWKSIEN